MLGRFIVLTITFVVVFTTASTGQSVLRYRCSGDQCCYPDGRCFSRHGNFGAPAPTLPGPEAPISGSPRTYRYPNSASGPQPNYGPRPDIRANPPSAGPVVAAPPRAGPVVAAPPSAGPVVAAPPSAGPVVAAPPRAGPSIGPGAHPSVGSDRVGNTAGTPATGTPAPTSPRILETGYAKLGEVGEEKPGYGLYSYVLVTSFSTKSVALLNEIFKVIPNVQSAGASPRQINILYIPFLKEKEREFTAAQSSSTLGTTYAQSFYNFQMARTILAHLCNPPADDLSQLCEGDLSRGPFIFTYEKPASTFEPIQAPYLFVDLRDVHEHAFAEFVSAYQQQVKSENVNSGERLNTLRLKLLDLALNAADFVKPIPDALADAIHSAKP
jgi:hypothetical protein